jgi:hypothetical protein
MFASHGVHFSLHHSTLPDKPPFWDGRTKLSSFEVISHVFFGLRALLLSWTADRVLAVRYCSLSGEENGGWRWRKWARRFCCNRVLLAEMACGERDPRGSSCRLLEDPSCPRFPSSGFKAESLSSFSQGERCDGRGGGCVLLIEDGDFELRVNHCSWRNDVFCLPFLLSLDVCDILRASVDSCSRGLPSPVRKYYSLPTPLQSILHRSRSLSPSFSLSPIFHSLFYSILSFTIVLFSLACSHLRTLSFSLAISRLFSLDIILSSLSLSLFPSPQLCPTLSPCL